MIPDNGPCNAIFLVPIAISVTPGAIVGLYIIPTTEKSFLKGKSVDSILHSIQAR